jgi:hypothetical protein
MQENDLLLTMTFSRKRKYQLEIIGNMRVVNMQNKNNVRVSNEPISLYNLYLRKEHLWVSQASMIFILPFQCSYILNTMTRCLHFCVYEKTSRYFLVKMKLIFHSHCTIEEIFFYSLSIETGNERSNNLQAISSL